MATSSDEMTNLSWRRFEDGDNVWDNLTQQIFVQDTSHKCPTYVHKTPPCQGSCPSGEDIRGWLQIVRGLEKPPEGMTWQEYAFRRSTDANPFPSMMGRVCPAPCQDGCNRNEVEDFVGINAVEQFIGDNATAQGYKFEPAPFDTGKRIAIIGGGPAGLAAAYQLRRKGHAATVFEANSELGGMFRYGIPGYRVPRDALDAEIARLSRQIDEATIPVSRKHALRSELGGLQDRAKKARKALAQQASKKAVEQAKALAQSTGDGNPVVAIIDAMGDRGALQSALSEVRHALPDSPIMLLSLDPEGKVALLADVPQIAVDRGLKAGDWVRAVAQVVGGKGGGRPNQAQGGGPDGEQIRAAADRAQEMALASMA